MRTFGRAVLSQIPTFKTFADIFRVTHSEHGGLEPETDFRQARKHTIGALAMKTFEEI